MDIIWVVVGNEELFVSDMSIKDAAILAIAMCLMERFGPESKPFLDFYGAICKYRIRIYEILIRLYEKELSKQRVFEEFDAIVQSEVQCFQIASKILSDALEKYSTA